MVTITTVSRYIYFNVITTIETIQTIGQKKANEIIYLQNDGGYLTNDATPSTSTNAQRDDGVSEMSLILTL